MKTYWTPVMQLLYPEKYAKFLQRQNQQVAMLNAICANKPPAPFDVADYGAPALNEESK